MFQIKTFEEQSLFVINKAVNTWLKETGVEAVNISFSRKDPYYTCAVLYKVDEKNPPKDYKSVFDNCR